MPPPAEPIGLELARTAKLVSRAFDDALVAAGASLPIWLILLSVHGQQHRAQRELAEAVGIEGPTLTHHLNRMEADGLVTRTRQPENRRVHQVELTVAGETLFQRLLTTVSAFDHRLQSGLAPKDTAAMRRVLARLRANVNAPDHPARNAKKGDNR